jgi:O-antigen ligase
MDRPMLGYGYGALWFPRSGFEDTQHSLLGLTWTAYHAHNGFLQLASEIGLPAAVLATSFAVISLVEVIRLFYLRESPYLLWVIAFQVAFLIANTFEALLLVDRNLNWILFVALPLSVHRSWQRLSWPVQSNRIASAEL